MQTKLCMFSAVTALLSVFAMPGKASLVGTSVTGSLTFANTGSTNYFDPLNGFVPSTGYLNTAGTTVSISNSAVEFGFDDGTNRISANFTNNQLVITDLVEATQLNNAWQLVFTDTSFAKQYLIPGIGTLPASSYSLTGDVITLNFPGGSVTQGQDLTATFTLTPVAEPSGAGTLAISFAIAAAVLLRRKFRSA